MLMRGVFCPLRLGEGLPYRTPGTRGSSPSVFFPRLPIIWAISLVVPVSLGTHSVFLLLPRRLVPLAILALWTLYLSISLSLSLSLSLHRPILSNVYGPSGHLPHRVIP
ncbi:hypothetical protein F4824DRAFT_446322 [Ustulina deusta]|nr:hypothetical protein F4824DRAFT_446322 [Ustulina deusta]